MELNNLVFPAPYAVKDGSLESLYYTVNGNTTNITNNTFDMPNGNTVVCATFKLAPKPICTFHFKKNSAKLENTKANKEAAKVIADKLAEGANITFNLEGWASPEGEGDHNQELSENRAKAVEQAVKDQLKKAKLNADNFNINTNGNGADWSDNFLNTVQNSSIKDKDAIVNVVKGLSGKSVAQKEQEIRNMINIYPELEKEILPQLRRAEVFVK